MAVQYTKFYEQLQSLVDSINHDSDPTARLRNLQQLQKDANNLILRSRNESAYDLRMKFSSQDAEALAGINRRHIDYWARKWATNKMLPPLKRHRRVDLSSFLDLSGELSSPSSSPLRPSQEMQD